MQYQSTQPRFYDHGLALKLAAIFCVVAAFVGCEKFKWFNSSKTTTTTSSSEPAQTEGATNFLAPNKTAGTAAVGTPTDTTATASAMDSTAPSLSGTVVPPAPLDSVVSAAIDNGDVTIVFVEGEKPFNLTFKKPTDMQGDVKVEESGTTIKAYHDGATANYASFRLEIARSKSLSFNLGSGNVIVDVSEAPTAGSRIELIVSNGNIKLQPAKIGISKLKGADGIVNSGAVSAAYSKVQITKNESFSSFSYSNEDLTAGATLNIRLFGGNVSL